LDSISRQPTRIVESALFATFLGSLLGTSALLGLEAIRSPAAFSSVREVLGLGLGLSLWAALIGLFVIALYAAPVMTLLGRFKLGGPISALGVGLLPAALLFVLRQTALSGFFLAYGLSVAVVFCAFAYRKQSETGAQL
jgi:hypothetical protein